MRPIRGVASPVVARRNYRAARRPTISFRAIDLSLAGIAGAPPGEMIIAWK